MEYSDTRRSLTLTLPSTSGAVCSSSSSANALTPLTLPTKMANLSISSPLPLPPSLSPLPSHSPRIRYLPSSSSTARSFHLHPTAATKRDESPPYVPSLLMSVVDWADEVKERGVRRRRELYNADTWRNHRSSIRHLRHVLSSLSSRVILSLAPPVSFLTTVAALVASYNFAVSAGLLPRYFPLLRASALPYQLTAPALALLLVFRTEASYARYVEARKAWMGVMSHTSELAGMVLSMQVNEGSEDAHTKKALLNYIMAFPVALKCHLISGSDVRVEMQGLLDEGDLTVLLGSRHHPRCIIDFISQSLQVLHIAETKRTIVESKISYFHEGISVCEHLMGIPIPLSYTRLTSRFLVFWHLTLPVILWDDCNWAVVPATFISAALLFCIEEVGVLIEEPFPVLALDELCCLVRSNIQEAITIENSIKLRVLAKRENRLEWDSSNGKPWI